MYGCHLTWPLLRTPTAGLRLPLIMLPSAMGAYFSHKAAINRFQTFLGKKEVPQRVPLPTTSEYAVVVESATFGWVAGPADKTQTKSAGVQLEEGVQLEDETQTKSTGVQLKESRKGTCKTEHVPPNEADTNFTLKDTTFTLKDINLKLRRGTLTAVVGGVGSGKSTLLLSVIGELSPIEGCILASLRLCRSY